MHEFELKISGMKIAFTFSIAVPSSGNFPRTFKLLLSLTTAVFEADTHPHMHTRSSKDLPFPLNQNSTFP